MTVNTEQSLRQELLTRNVWQLMLKLSLPATIAMSITAINTFVDGLFVGRYIGQNALAAISLVLPLTMIPNAFAALIGGGTSSLLSISIGSGNVPVQKKIFGTLAVLSTIVAAILTVLGLYFAKELILLMGGKGEVLDLAVVYFRLALMGSIFRIFAVAANMLIRAEGKVQEAMTYSITSVILNIILNPILIHYCDMGIAGSGWANLISMIVFTLFGLWYFLTKKTTYPIEPTSYSLERYMLRPILSVGLSAMMLQLMFFIQQVVVFRSLTHYGTDRDVAFMGACYRILLMVIVPGFGFAQAMQPLVGINYGAQNYARVRQAFKVFTLSYTIVLFLIWLVVMFFPAQTLAWMLPDMIFTPQDLLHFRLMMLPLPLFPFFLISTSLFQSIGNAKIAGLVTAARELILYTPLVLVLPFWFGITGIYATIIPVNVIIFIISIIIVRRQFAKWQ